MKRTVETKEGERKERFEIYVGGIGREGPSAPHLFGLNVFIRPRLPHQQQEKEDERTNKQTNKQTRKTK